MNCANHPDRERTAFCQNCGKPLCNECVRNVGTSVFCEPCLTARVAGAPPMGYPAGPAAYVPPPSVPGEPNPGIAALLGFIPGVGAMYNGQYAKGIVHLIVFAMLVSLANDVNDIFGLFIAGWIAYMVIEAHHTAKARRDGTPLPNPFGLNDLSERLGFGKAWPGSVPPTGADPTAQYPGQYPGPPPANPPQDSGTTYAAGGGYYQRAADGSQTYSAPGAYYYRAPDGSQSYSAGAPPYGVPPIPPIPPVPPYPEPDPSYYRRFPSGAIWLIVLGLFFLAGNAPFFHFFHGRFLWPILLIGFGVWTFVRRMTCTGQGIENDGTPLYHWRLKRAIHGAFWIVLTGVIWLLDELHILSWSRSWPLFLIGWGLMMVFGRTAFSDPGYGYPPPPTTPPPAAPVTSTAMIQTEPPRSQPDGNDQEGS